MQTTKRILSSITVASIYMCAIFTTAIFATALLAPFSPVCAQTSDLFISEYVEGSSNNKALEIFNGTADDIELSDYHILRFSNGSTSSTTISLNAHTMEPGSVYVIVNEFADADLLAMAQQTSSELNFNGNDSLVLKRGSLVVDSFGRVGEDPGTAWTCPGGTTLNQTLRRLPAICNGDTVIDDEFNPCLEYEFYSVDTFDGLGDHFSDCASVSTGHDTWNEVKALYR